MKTLALRDGDLALDGNAYAMVEGIDRVKQQIGLCLREPYGTDRFHPRWGSVLPNWIGRAIVDSSLPIEMKAELGRVVRNFVNAQNAAIEKRAVRGYSPVLLPSEIIVAIAGITTEQRQDTIIAKIALQTAGGRILTVETAPGSYSGYTQ
jgi:phage baseplate assembly protein W